MSFPSQQDSSFLPSQLRVLLDMNSSTGRKNPPLLHAHLPELVPAPAVVSQGLLLQGMLRTAAASTSISHQYASIRGSAPSILGSTPSAGLGALKVEGFAGHCVAERALLSESDLALNAPVSSRSHSILSSRSHSIQREKHRMIQEYMDLTHAINEMKKQPVLHTESRFSSSSTTPKNTDERCLVSERNEIAMDPHNKTPEQVFYILNVLGSTLRSKSDPYIDASIYVDPGTNRAVRGGIVELFPDKLYRMLIELEAEGKSEIASFLPHGRSFMVHKMDEFLSEVLPRFFSEQSKWSSFSRQLNLYGFMRCNSGPDCGSYYHELFLKDRPNLCNYMRRVGAPKGCDRRKVKLLEGGHDPDFNAMPSMKPPQHKMRSK